MQLPYTVDAVLAILQLAAAGALLFVVVPWLVFDPHSTRPFGPRLFDHVAVGVVAAGLLVPVLSALRVLDGVSLMVSVAVLALAAARRRGVAVRTALVAAWRRAGTTLLDRFEGSGRRRVPKLTWPRLDPGPGRRAVLAGGLALGAVIAWLALGDAVAHPGPDVPGHGARVLRIENLGLRRPFADGVHHMGIESVLGAIGRVVTIDTPMLVRLAPGLALVALAGGVVWSGWRITGRGGAGLVGGAVVALATQAPWWPLGTPTADVLTIAGAAAFVAPAIAVAIEGRAAYLGVTVAAAALLHPLVGGVVAVAIVAGWAVAAAMGEGRRWRIPVAAVAGAATGWLPILLGLAMGEPWNDGPFGVEAALGPAFHGITGLPPDLQRPHLLLIAALVAALLLVLAPGRVGTRPRASILGGALVVLVVLVQPYRVGVVDPLAPSVAAMAASPAIALAVAALARAVSRRPAVLLAMAAAIALASLPLPDAIERYERADQIAARVRDIGAANSPFRWTVVAEPAALTLVPSDGFFVDAPTFLASYDPTTWRFDPGHPELALPTRHVYVFVPTGVAETPVANQTVSSDALLGFDDLTSGAGAGTSARALAEWVERYRLLHDDIRVAWSDDDLVVFHIERSEDEEREIIRAFELEREAERDGATRCRAVGDFLLFPTPRSFEVCA